MDDAEDEQTEALLDVWVNCPGVEHAERIADHLLAERLAAAANIFPPIKSRYHWKGTIETKDEVPLRLKTRASLFETVQERITALHPYETPGILGIEVTSINAVYRDWLLSETAP